MRFVDTNVLVYAQQPAAGDKHERAKAVVKEIWRTRDGAVSAQVLQEFYVTVTSPKLEEPLSTSVAERLVSTYLAWKVVPITGELVREAIGLREEAHLSYWDAAIVAAAVEAGAAELLSEDLNAGQVIRGVRIRNPFAD